MSTIANPASQTSRRHPIGELLQRYRAVAQTARGHRHGLAGPARMADEAAFLLAALSLQATPCHPAPRRALWACIGQVDIVAVAPRRIVVSDGIKLIQPLEAEWRDTQAQLAPPQADIVTRQAELQTVKEQIEKLQATLPIVRKREDDFQTLQAQDFVSQHAGQDHTQARIEMERDLATQRARQVEVKASIAQAEHNHAPWRTEALKTLSERHAKADLQARSLQVEGAKTSQREQLTALRAPVSGNVQQRAVHTTGGVVTPAQVLMVVVPDATQVTADVMLENKDVGFVHLGQEAAIKLETFPFTRYGKVEAKVTIITADAAMKGPSVQPDKGGKAIASGGAVFPVTLTLGDHASDVDEKTIRMAPGMNFIAEIKTGKRRAIEYFLSPVQSHAEESLRAR